MFALFLLALVSVASASLQRVHQSLVPSTHYNSPFVSQVVSPHNVAQVVSPVSGAVVSRDFNIEGVGERYAVQNGPRQFSYSFLKGADLYNQENPLVAPQYANRVVNPYGVSSVAVNPYGVSSYGVNPYGVSSYGVNPYGVSSYGVNPYGISSFGVNPYQVSSVAVNPLNVGVGHYAGLGGQIISPVVQTQNAYTARLQPQFANNAVVVK